MNDFEYARPDSVPAAVALLSDRPEARPLAGGQSLIGAMKLGLAAPDRLVDLAGIPRLRDIAASPDSIRVGSMATHEAVAHHPDIAARLPALSELAGGIGDPGVRSLGTLGGSLANNDPAACYPAAALGLGATIHTDRRSIPADAFFVGFYATALEPGEIITAVDFPVAPRSAYVKLPHPASRFALVGVFVARTARDVRVAVTGAGPGVFRATELERALAAAWDAATCRRATIPADGLGSDMHASARYRAAMVVELAARAIERADQHFFVARNVIA